ncbi:MAG: hypothetical protein ACRC0V_12685 [Fusobacteriaceae bacterium]|uniref:hypothetical protein n=1 Tax=Cetobacterium sp. TaxID=2071632 RepID=UPI003F35DDFE
MEISKIIEELIKTKILNIEKIELIRGGKLKALINSKYDSEFGLNEINDCLKKNFNFIEISNNLFVLKTKLENILKDSSRNEYKKILEKLYIIEIDDKHLLNIDIDSRGRTYEEIKKYGLENSYIKAEWLENIDLNNSEIYEVHEAYQELLKLGIEIK